MPEYDVIGADRRTGQERRTTVLAADEAEAARLVERHLLVERIVVVPTAGPAYWSAPVPASPGPAAAAQLVYVPTPPSAAPYAPATTQPLPNLSTRSTSATATARLAAPAAAAAARRPADAPRYVGIRVGAVLLRIIGGVLIAISLVHLTLGVVHWAKLSSDVASPAQLVAIVLGASQFVAYGVLAIFVASVGQAVGDTARNSFRQIS